MKNIEKDIVNETKISKELLEEKSKKIIEDLDICKQTIMKEDNESEDDSLFEYNPECGYIFDSNKLDEDGIDTVKEIFQSNPTFALNFLERRKDAIDEEEYIRLKNIIIDKMNLK